jgi:hypothetical protein
MTQIIALITHYSTLFIAKDEGVNGLILKGLPVIASLQTFSNDGLDVNKTDAIFSHP